MTTEQGMRTSAARSEHRWQIQSEGINNALAPNGIQPGGIFNSIDSSSLTHSIRIQVNLGYQRLRAIMREIADTLKPDGVRTHRPNDVLNYKIARSEDIAVPLLDLLARNEKIPHLSAALGFAEDGNTVFYKIDSRDTPHLLVLGGKDAGKTVMLRSIAVSLAMNNRQSDIQLAVISPLATTREKQQRQAAVWLPLNYLPHLLCDVAFKHTDIVDLLAFLSQEIAYREKHSFCAPHVVVLIDQADTLLRRGGRQCAEPIFRLAQAGKYVGIHLVIAGQSANSDSFNTQLKKAFSTHLVGRSDNRAAVDNSSPLSNQDEYELLGQGDFYLRQGGREQRLQGAFIDDYDLHLTLAQLYRHRAILLANPAENRLRLKRSSQLDNEIRNGSTENFERLSILAA